MKTFSLLSYFLLVLLVGCSKNKSIPGDPGAVDALKNNTFFEEIGNVRPYNPEALYAFKTRECVYANTEASSCKMGALPLLGMSKYKISVKDIMDRTLVSHAFMAESFREVLIRLPAETLQMFGSVNAIVISDKINPSFYYANSGAIYLSGTYFWRNANEYEIVSQSKDSREGAGLPMQFIFDHDYIKNGKSISSRAQQNFQSYDEMAIKASRVLFHELTHANDFFPSSLYASDMENKTKSYSELASDHYDKKLISSMNLPSKPTSKKLSNIAQVLYFEKEAGQDVRSMLAEEVVEEFRKDVVTDEYSYSNHFEDLAMCAEESLMLYYYNIPRYVVVIKLPKSDFIPPENYVYQIIWGEKSRVLESEIKPRAFYAVENALGVQIASRVLDKLNLGVPLEIPANSTWDEVYAL